MTRRTAVVVLLVLLPVATAGAATPYWGYGQYARTWVRLQSDQEGEGSAGLLSLPLADAVHVVATGYEFDAWFTDPGVPITERYAGGTAALGVHSAKLTRAHAFGTLGYSLRERRTRSATGERTDVSEGGFLTVGARWLIAPWFSFEPEGGIAYSGDYDVDAIVHVRLGLRLVPRVWLVGGYHQDNGVFVGSDSHYWSAGLRLSWCDSTRRQAGARPVRTAGGEPAAAGLAAGQTLEAVRPLKLQERPLAGAPETVDVPIGARIVLQESTANDFGTWWRVTAGGREGWIRESQLR